MGPRAFARTAIAVAAVLIAVLATLALLDAFLIEPSPGDPSPRPGGGQEQGGGGEGGSGPTCEGIAKGFFWAFIVAGAVSFGLFGVAVWRRDRWNGKIGASPWGILSVVGAFLTVILYGCWRLLDTLCAGEANCDNANDGTFTSFLVLVALTLVGIGLGIYFAWRNRSNFFTTGWGLLGVIFYVPALLTGFAWFFVRTVCSENLSCRTRDEFLATLAWVYWLSLIVALAAVAMGIFAKMRWGQGFFRSGWGVLVILLGLLSVFAGSGWLYVNDIKIPGCDTLDPLEQPQTCEAMREDLQGGLGLMFWILVGVGVAGLVTALALHRQKLKNAWGSPFAVLGYITLSAALLVGLAWLLAGSLCGQGDDENQGQGDGDGGQNGDQQGGGDGGDGPSGGDPGGGQGGDPGTGGNQAGPGGGSGGLGDANPLTTPLEFDPQMLTWLLVAFAVLVGIALLVYLLRFRPGRDGKGIPTPAGAENVQAGDQKRLLGLLAQGQLESRDAVIAAYRAFLAWSVERGLAKEVQETPREHAERVRQAYPVVTQESMRGFVRAYEVARLSPRDPTPDERAGAIRFSQELRRTTAAAVAQKEARKA